MSTLSRFPARRFYGQMMQTQLHAMSVERDRLNKQLDAAGYVGRRVLGYKLPVWQRQECWTDAQCARFLESVWLGVGLGAFMVNFSGSGLDDDTHMTLLDGQQRLRAIERYWLGELAVQGDDGNCYFWTELTKDEQAHFMRIPFPWICTNYSTDAELRVAYDKHNFGGVAHALSEMASIHEGR